MERNAYAKINWDLHILGKRPDGFHQLDSIMVSVSLCDTLTFLPNDALVFTCSDPSLPTDESNLVVKAARLLAQAAGVRCAAKIHLTKRIPTGGGLGGGSSDAACTLAGLNRLWDLNWSVARLHPLAAQLGSDVAFFLYGGWQRCQGRGEIIEPIPGSSTWPSVRLLLVAPPLHVATPAVYKALNAPSWDGNWPSRDLTKLHEVILSATRAVDAEDALMTRNDLTVAARCVAPGLVALQDILEERYAGRWKMSGSGAVHFVLPASPQDTGKELEAKLRQQIGSSTQVHTVMTFTPSI